MPRCHIVLLDDLIKREKRELLMTIDALFHGFN